MRYRHCDHRYHFESERESSRPFFHFEYERDASRPFRSRWSGRGAPITDDGDDERGVLAR